MATNPEVIPYQENIRPGFVGDFLSREHVLAGGIKIDAATFPAEDAIRASVGVAGAAVGAIAVPVAALLGVIPSGTVLDFGGAKFARLSAKADSGATSLAVAPLPTALVAGDRAFYSPPGVGHRIAAGRVVGCTVVELEGGTSGLKWGRAVDTDDLVRLLAYDVDDASSNDDANLLRPGTLVYVNFLPGWSELSSALKTKIYAAYDCSIGAPSHEVSA